MARENCCWLESDGSASIRILLLAEAHAAMAYYFDYQAEIDAGIRKELQEANREHEAAHDSPLRLCLRVTGLL